VVEACTAVVLVDGMRLVSWAALSIVPGTWRSQTYLESCRSRGWHVAQDGTRRKTGRACYLRVARSHGVSSAVGRVRGLMGCVGAVGMTCGRKQCTSEVVSLRLPCMQDVLAAHSKGHSKRVRVSI